MSFFIVENLCVNSILLDPLNKELSCEGLAIKHPAVTNDGVEVSDALDSALQEAGLETHKCDLKLYDLSHLFSFIFVDYTSLEVVNTLNNALNLFSAHIPEGLLWGLSQGFCADITKSGSVLSDEIFMVHLVGIRQCCHDDRK